jgi:hypothetical protein
LKEKEKSDVNKSDIAESETNRSVHLTKEEEETLTAETLDEIFREQALFDTRMGRG